MKQPLLLIVILFLGACNNSPSHDQKIFQEGVSDGKTTRAREAVTEQDQEARKLRYLYASNGGLIGYFSDNSIAGCPKCDFMRENIEALYREKPIGTYTVNAKGDLITSRKETLHPATDKDWVLVDYQWTKTAP